MTTLIWDLQGAPLSGPLSIDWSVTLAEHDRWLRRVVYARLGRKDEVDEVMQEVALAAVRQSAPLMDPTKAAPWLYRLAVRQCLLLRRQLGRRRKLLGRVRERAIDGEGISPLQWLLSRERQGHVRGALNSLTPRECEILLLKYGESWSYQQIAEHLGVSPAAVEARLFRARRRLRQVLANTPGWEVQR